jgi:hypothetical protein
LYPWAFDESKPHLNSPSIICKWSDFAKNQAALVATIDEFWRGRDSGHGRAKRGKTSSTHGLCVRGSPIRGRPGSLRPPSRDRYGARLAWLATLVVLIAAVRYFGGADDATDLGAA